MPDNEDAVVKKGVTLNTWKQALQFKWTLLKEVMNVMKRAILALRFCFYPMCQLKIYIYIFYYRLQNLDNLIKKFFRYCFLNNQEKAAASS